MGASRTRAGRLVVRAARPRRGLRHRPGGGRADLGCVRARRRHPPASPAGRSPGQPRSQRDPPGTRQREVASGLPPLRGCAARGPAARRARAHAARAHGGGRPSLARRERPVVRRGRGHERAARLEGLRARARCQPAPRSDREGTLSMSLPEIRERIDAVDLEIFELIERRAELVRELARERKNTGTSTLHPEREREILARFEVRAETAGLPRASIREIYREIMSAFLSIEQTHSVAYMGPPGTFSHIAARNAFGL